MTDQVIVEITRHLVNHLGGKPGRGQGRGDRVTDHTEGVEVGDPWRLRASVTAVHDERSARSLAVPLRVARGPRPAMFP